MANIWIQRNLNVRRLNKISEVLLVNFVSGLIFRPKVVGLACTKELSSYSLGNIWEISSRSHAYRSQLGRVGGLILGIAFRFISIATVAGLKRMQVSKIFEAHACGRIGSHAHRSRLGRVGEFILGSIGGETCT